MPQRGNAADAPKPPVWTKGWKIDKPDLVLRMPNAMQIPAAGDIPYQYIIIPTDFKVDRWVRMCEIRPSNRQVVHHAVAYVREPGSDWLQGAPVGKPFSAEDLSDPKQRRDAMWTTSDILLVYAPGSLPDGWGPGYAKLIPAGSDIVLQMHYVSTGMSAMHGMRGGQSKMAGAERTASPAQDQTSIGLVFADQPTRKRVLTLQLTNDKFLIPPRRSKPSGRSSWDGAERLRTVELLPPHASAGQELRVHGQSSERQARGAVEYSTPTTFLGS